MAQAAKLVNLKRGFLVYRQGFPAEGVFLLCRGSVKLTIVSQTGSERIAALVVCGELFGLDSLLSDPVRGLSAVARENGQAAFLSTAQFRKALHENPELLWKVMLMLNEMLHRATNDKLAISGARVNERIESVLLGLKHRLNQHESVCKPLFAKLKQRELSELLGVPEETICRELRSMREAKNASLSIIGTDASAA